MYKSKFKVWILLLLLSFILGSIGKIKDFFSAETFNAYVSIEDNSLRNKFNGYKKSNAKINLVSDINNSDIIIKNNSDEEIDGYIKYSKQFTSPIVMFVPYDAYDIENSGFNKDSISTTWSTHYYIQKDLKIILEAIENNKNYTDIGINKEIFGDTKVQIAIPDKNNCYYEEVELLITLALNNYSYDNIDEPKLKERVNDIIEKSVTYEDAASYIKKINEDGKKGKKTIVLAPEYISTKGLDISGSNQKTYSYIICVPNKTICLEYDLYIKNVDNFDEKYNDLLKSLTKTKFMETTGLRNKERDFTISDATNFYYSLDSISIIKK
jgi:hypothetical protein